MVPIVLDGVSHSNRVYLNMEMRRKLAITGQYRHFIQTEGINEWKAFLVVVGRDEGDESRMGAFVCMLVGCFHLR